MDVKVPKLNTSRMASRLSSLIPRALPLAVRQDILADRLEPVKELMKAKAHKDTGESADSIDIEVQAAADPTTAQVAVGVGRDGYPLFFQEYGTKEKAPRPTIRPSWESESGRVRDAIAGDVSQAIKKAVAS